MIYVVSKEGWKPAGARIGGCKKSRVIFVSVRRRFRIIKRLLLVQNLSHNSCYLSFLWGDLCYVCGLAAAFLLPAYTRQFCKGAALKILKHSERWGSPLLVKTPKTDRLDLDISNLLLDIPVFILHSSFRTTQLFTGLHAFHPLAKCKQLYFS